MTAPFLLSRARLSENASAKALIQLIAPRKKDDRTAVSHKLVWTLFADHEERTRDFLWREEGDGTFFIMSSREPIDAHNLFDLEPAKLFEPSLKAGDRLHFSLRANATITQSDSSVRGTLAAKGSARKRYDVVMAALHAIPRGEERAKARRDVEQSASRKWLEQQGERNGFSVQTLSCLGYETLKLPHRGRAIELGVVDLEGILQVGDPELFLGALRKGFGRAKAYGFGLMLIRRAT
jgi:CRISPR system Cascade subunit CasE